MTGESCGGDAPVPVFEVLELRLLLSAVDPQQSLALFGLSPALFVENHGQCDESVRFLHDGAGADVAMTDAGPVFRIYRPADEDGHGESDDSLGFNPSRPNPRQLEVLQFSASFVGANLVRPAGLEPSGSTFNHFLGTQAGWRANVPAFEVVAYEGLYAGIDLLTWGQRDSLKYEFHVAPGADWSMIAVRYDGIAGLGIDESGSLVVDLGNGWGHLIDDAPYIYQVIDDMRVEVAGRFVLVDQWTYAFEIVGEYAPGRTLVIDPDLSWGSYLGGDVIEVANGVTVDSQNNVLVTGHSSSSDWLSGSNPGGYSAFVVKLNALGQHEWSTYLGGDEWDSGNGIAVDANDNVYIVGVTYSDGWVSDGYDTEFGGGPVYWLDADGFVVKLDSDGDHQWSTYLGGNHYAGAYGVAVDEYGDVLVVGSAYSSQWLSGYHGGTSDGFVVKLKGDGSALLWGSYLGGNDGDGASGVVVDGDNNVVVVGGTTSTNMFATGATLGPDGFVIKLDGATGGADWGRYVGDDGSDSLYGVVVDGEGDVYVVGWTTSDNTAEWISGSWLDELGGGSDVFVFKLSGYNGTDVWSTYVGGNADEYNDGGGIAIDPSDGTILVTGGTQSDGWVSGGWATTLGGVADAFVVKLDVENGDHVWSSYVGGAGGEYGFGIAVDSDGAVLVVGRTTLSAAPGHHWVSGGWDTTPKYTYTDGFVVRVAGRVPDALTGTDDADVYRVVLDGDDLVVYVAGLPMYRSRLSSVTTLTFNAGDGDDELTVDASNGDPTPTGGLFFNGGAGADSLIIDGGTVIFDGGSGDDELTITGGTVITETAQTLGYLNIDGGMLDITDAGFTLYYTGTSPFTDIRTWVFSGFNGGP